MREYRFTGWRLGLHLGVTIIGLLVCVLAAVSFLFEFKNYHCAAWAGAATIFASIALGLHVAAWRDVTLSIRPPTFTILSYIGLFGTALGFVGFVVYLLEGILAHESGVKVRGWFIVTVWNYFTWKWGLILFVYARRYRKRLLDATSDILTTNSADYSIQS